MGKKNETQEIRVGLGRAPHFVTFTSLKIENQFNKNGKIKLDRIAFHFKIKRIKEQTQSD